MRTSWRSTEAAVATMRCTPPITAGGSGSAAQARRSSSVSRPASSEPASTAAMARSAAAMAAVRVLLS